MGVGVGDIDYVIFCVGDWYVYILGVMNDLVRRFRLCEGCTGGIYLRHLGEWGGGGENLIKGKDKSGLLCRARLVL